MRDYGELYWIKPARWQFVQQGLVTDLLQVVRPGKEATVYLCQAGPLLDLDYLALKAYSPTMTPLHKRRPLRPLHPSQALSPQPTHASA